MEPMDSRRFHFYARLMTVPKTRGVGLIRLSVSPDPASTSVERQKEIQQAYADAQNIIIVGWAVDMATSAFHVPPEKRKAIRVWLNQPDEFDCFIYWRQDRLVRRTRDFMGMIKWCQDNEKKLYSATEGLGDVTTHAGVLMGFITAWQAEGESRNTSTRVKGSMQKLREEGRYGGGRIAYWQRSICICHEREKCPEGKARGWKRAIDESKARPIREAVRRVTAGESSNAVISDFNKRGVKAQDGGMWHVPVLRRILRNRNLFEGGLITAEEWGQLQDALDARSINRQIRTTNRDNITLDLFFCGDCGGKIWKQPCRDRDGKPRTYGWCQNMSKRYEVETPCTMRVPYKILEDFVQADVEAHWDYIIETRLTNTSRKLRIEEIDKELLALTADKVAGRIDRQTFMARQTALMDEADALQSDQEIQEWHSTGETVGERWKRLSDAERRLWLLGIGTTFTVYREYDQDRKRKRFIMKSSWSINTKFDAQRGIHVPMRRERVVRAA